MNARALAIQVLARVEASDAYLNVILDHKLSETPPSDRRDAGFITELCYGAMRRRLTLDSVIALYADRKLASIEDRVLAALRVGTYQIFYSRVPRRAAVAETVEALKVIKLERAVGFVNALLRKISALEVIPLPPEATLAEHLAVRESHPTWLVARWLRQFGRERTESMLVANNLAPDVVVRTNSAQRTREALLEELLGVGLTVAKTGLSDVGLKLASPGKVEALYGYDEGLWQVQDEGAQLVGLYGAIPPTARVLDACAAPGGKACHLAETHDLVASDLHPNKLPKILAEAKRLRLEGKMKLISHDATTPFPEELGTFDAVTVDAPCTGLGTLRRHPELRYRRAEGDVARLAVLQLKILETCQALVNPGGLLVYAVCSTEPQEGQDLVEMFLRSHPEFTAEPPPRFSESAWPKYQSYLRTLPGPEGMDGFFAARLRKMY